MKTKNKNNFEARGSGSHETDLKLFDNAVIAWQTPEYPHHEKSFLWYLLAGISVLLLVLYGLKTDGWTFSVAILVFAGTYYFFQMHTPQLLEVKISDVGIKIGNHLFPYLSLKGFWIVYDPPHVKKLYIRSAGHFAPDVFVSLDGVDPSKLRAQLKIHLPQLPPQCEPIADSLVRLLHL